MTSENIKISKEAFEEHVNRLNKNQSPLVEFIQSQIHNTKNNDEDYKEKWNLYCKKLY